LSSRNRLLKNAPFTLRLALRWAQDRLRANGASIEIIRIYPVRGEPVEPQKDFINKLLKGEPEEERFG
jgi:hypothetical protein